MTTKADINNIARYRAVISGRVQGVGCRQFIKTNARQLELAGWVMNMSDGTVAMEVEGLSAKVAKLWEIIRAGNMFVKVDDLIIEELPQLVGEQTFSVKY